MWVLNDAGDFIVFCLLFQRGTRSKRLQQQQHTQIPCPRRSSQNGWLVTASLALLLHCLTLVFSIFIAKCWSIKVVSSTWLGHIHFLNNNSKTRRARSKSNNDWRSKGASSIWMWIFANVRIFWRLSFNCFGACHCSYGSAVLPGKIGPSFMCIFFHFSKKFIPFFGKYINVDHYFLQKTDTKFYKELIIY